MTESSSFIFEASEVATRAAIKPYELKLWENEFSQIAPEKRGEIKFYSQKDLDLIIEIKDQIYNQGFTLEKVKAKMRQLDQNFDSKGEQVVAEMNSSSELKNEVRETQTLFHLPADSVASPIIEHSHDTPSVVLKKNVEAALEEANKQVKTRTSSTPIFRPQVQKGLFFGRKSQNQDSPAAHVEDNSNQQDLAGEAISTLNDLNQELSALIDAGNPDSNVQSNSSSSDSEATFEIIKGFEDSSVETKSKAEIDALRKAREMRHDRIRLIQTELKQLMQKPLSDFFHY